MKDYIQQALRTESPVTEELHARLIQKARAIHAIFGLSTETGELVDGFKRAIFYGKTLDTTNIKEEIGDVLWYLAILMDDFGVDFEGCMLANIEKLRKRYPEKYSHESALNRDLGVERATLEEHLDKSLPPIIHCNTQTIDPIPATADAASAVAERNELNRSGAEATGPNPDYKPPTNRWRQVEVVCGPGYECGVMIDDKEFGFLGIAVRKVGEEWPKGKVPESSLIIESNHNSFVVEEDGKD